MSKLVKTENNSFKWASDKIGEVQDFTKFCTAVQLFISTNPDPELNLVYNDKSAYNAVGHHSLLQYLVRHHSTEPSTWNFINKILAKGLEDGPDFISLSRGWDQTRKCGVAQGDEILKALLEQSANFDMAVFVAVFKNLLTQELYFLPAAYQGNYNAVNALVDHMQFCNGDNPDGLIKLTEKYITNNLDGDNSQIVCAIVSIIAEYQDSREAELLKYQTQLIVSSMEIATMCLKTYQKTTEFLKPYFCGSAEHQKFALLSQKIFSFSQEAAEAMRHEFYGKFTGRDGMPTLDSFFNGGLLTQMGAIFAADDNFAVVSSGQKTLKDSLKKFEREHGIDGYWQDYDDNSTASSAFYQDVGVTGEGTNFYENDEDDFYS